jgi:hypothetical protein
MVVGVFMCLKNSLIEKGNMKFLEKGSLPDLMRLQSVIAANLPCPEIFMLHDEKYFQEALRLERSVIGVVTKEGLIAYSIIRIPGHCDDNLGRDIDLPEEELPKLAHLQAAAVHPAYRGNGLQRKLTYAHLAVIEEMGCEHVSCTVSPKNPVSLANYLSCGLAIEGLRPKMQGWWRYILHRNILLPNSSNMDLAAIHGVGIKISDTNGQLDLLKRGYRGIKIACLPTGAEVFYAKL